MFNKTYKFTRLYCYGEHQLYNLYLNSKIQRDYMWPSYYKYPTKQLPALHALVLLRQTKKWPNKFFSLFIAFYCFQINIYRWANRPTKKRVTEFSNTQNRDVFTFFLFTYFVFLHNFTWNSPFTDTVCSLPAPNTTLGTDKTITMTSLHRLRQ